MSNVLPIVNPTGDSDLHASPEQADRRFWKEILWSVPICAYIFMTISWLSPESELRTRIISPVKVWWQFCGLNQNWSLFSPVIRSINYHTVATLTYEDGTKMYITMPRMDRLSIGDRFTFEKFRKWDVDSLPWPDYKSFWPDYARHIGRMFYKSENKPVQLSLHLFWTDIPAPTEQLRDRSKLPAHDKFETVFSYYYQKGDLP